MIYVRPKCFRFTIEGIESVAAQHTWELAAEWYRRAGDLEAAQDATYSIVQRLIAEAEVTEAFRASVHLEMAIKILRTLPRAARQVGGFRPVR